VLKEIPQPLLQPRRLGDLLLPNRVVMAADILRIEDGILAEHWDVIQDKATKEQSKSGNPMFGDSFPDRAKRP